MSERPELSRARHGRVPVGPQALARVGLLAAVLSLVLGWQAFAAFTQPLASTAPRFAVSPPAATPPANALVASAWKEVGPPRDIPMPPGVPAAHASSLLALPAGQVGAASSDLLAAWFAGSRESGADVQIWMARFDGAAALGAGAWQAPVAVLNRHALAQQLGFGVRRLGNPVLWRDADGRLQLFVVATGLGGWAASRVLQVQLEPAAAAGPGWTVTHARVLPLSPLWNLSTLVRTQAAPLADGGAWLPTYFELWRKYPSALRVGPLGEFVAPVRLSHQGGGLQPAVVPLSAREGLALMRDFSAGAVRVAHTGDGGQSWEDRPPLAVLNPNASVAALRLTDGSLAMVANPQRTGRQRLDLLRSADGVTWTLVATLEDASPGAEFSYPALALSADGRRLHVSYTFERKRIRHRVFDWVAAR